MSPGRQTPARGPERLRRLRAGRHGAPARELRQRPGRPARRALRRRSTTGPSTRSPGRTRRCCGRSKELAWLAIERIDISRQQGAHPRIGSLDVCPIVWPEPALRARAHEVAMAVAEQLGSIGLPVFLYGELASTPERAERAYFRRGGHVELARRMRDDGLDARLRPRLAAPDRGRRARHRPGAARRLQHRCSSRAPTSRPARRSRPRCASRAAACSASARSRSSWRPAGSRSRPTSTTRSRCRWPRSSRRPQRIGASRGTTPVEAELVGLVPEAALAGYPGGRPDRRAPTRGAHDRVAARLRARA